MKGCVPASGNLLQMADNGLCPIFLVPFSSGCLNYRYVGALVTNLDHKDESHLLGMADQGAGKSLGPQGPNRTGLPCHPRTARLFPVFHRRGKWTPPYMSHCILIFLSNVSLLFLPFRSRFTLLRAYCVPNILPGTLTCLCHPTLSNLSPTCRF